MAKELHTWSIVRGFTRTTTDKFTLPTIMKSAVTPDYDVLIVGCGPTGATLALLLATSGIKILIVEREASHYMLPRAVHFDDEIMRVFQAIGIVDELQSVIRFNPGMQFYNSGGELLLDWPRSNAISSNGWHSSYRFHQPDLESILRQKIGQSPNIKLMTESEVIAIEDHGPYCETSIKLKGTQSLNNISSKYVVGCDGARSSVRKLLHTTMIDLGFKERWLVVDLILHKDKPELGDYTIQNCDPARPSTYVRCPGNRRRWEITVLSHEQADEIARPESIWKLLSQWISKDEAAIERGVVYQFESAIAGKWRKGRILLAGDAAHLTPPFLGQGMCSGIRDVVNLAWKLVLCTEKHSTSLLNSYQSERSPHARQYIETAIKLGGLINTSNTKAALISAFSQSDGSVKMTSICPLLGEGLSAGQTFHRGKIFPQERLEDGQLFDDSVGYLPVLVVSAAFCDTWSDTLDQYRYNIFLKIVKRGSCLSAVLNDLETQAILVRPDRYILGTADNQESFVALLNASLELAYGRLRS